MPEKTAEVLDPTAGCATGDVGEIDADGYLRIVDRKKELIINSAGKNMSPANIESALKGASPLIGQACVIGDARPYNTALVVLDPEYAAAWASQRGIADTPLADLARDARVRAARPGGRRPGQRAAVARRAGQASSISCPATGCRAATS